MTTSRAVLIACGLACTLVAWGCENRAPQRPSAYNDSITESLTVSLGTSRVSVADFQHRLAELLARGKPSGVEISVNPVMTGRPASQAFSSTSYRAALDDAHAKALALAADARVTLGAVQSIVEDDASSSAGSAQHTFLSTTRLKGNAGPAAVRGPGGGLRLDVTYAIGAGSAREIAVFGYADDASHTPGTPPPSRSLNVQVNAHGQSAADAQRGADQDAALVMQAARELDARSITVTVNGGSISTQ